MNTARVCCVAAFLLLAVAAVRGQEKKGVTISDKSFRQVSFLLTEDPLNKSSRDWARLILLYTLQTSDAVVVLGEDELKWVGGGSEHGLVLMAAYLSGNIQSQLNSGVKRNDRYAGVLSLFRVYRALREKDKDFKIPQVDDLLLLHRDNRLLRHLQKIEDESPSRLGPAEVEAIRKLMKTR